MTDPNTRRLLRVAQSITNKRHFAFLPDNKKKKVTELKYQALFDHDMITLNVLPIRFPLKNAKADKYSRLPELINLLPVNQSDFDDLFKKH